MPAAFDEQARRADVRDASPVVVLRDPDAETLRRELARGAVVIVSDSAAALIEIASQSGRPWGVVPLDAQADALEAVVAAVAAGFAVIPAAVGLPAEFSTGHVSPRPQPATRAAAPARSVEPLTPREREVLQRLAEGLPNRAIALALGISDHTVKFHLSSIFGKLGAGTRTEAVRLGLRQGLVVI
jgi:DNA-binding NarL/FixJ family response regulator